MWNWWSMRRNRLPVWEYVFSLLNWDRRFPHYIINFRTRSRLEVYKNQRQYPEIFSEFTYFPPTDSYSHKLLKWRHRSTTVKLDLPSSRDEIVKVIDHSAHKGGIMMAIIPVPRGRPAVIIRISTTKSYHTNVSLFDQPRGHYLRPLQAFQIVSDQFVYLRLIITFTLHFIKLKPCFLWRFWETTKSRPTRLMIQDLLGYPKPVLSWYS